MNEEQRKQQIQSKMTEIENKHQTMNEERLQAILVRKEQENLKKLERIRAVQRMQRQKEHEKEQMLMKF